MVGEARRMMNILKNTGIGLRIVLTSIGLIAVTVIVVSYLYYRYASNDIRREYYQHSSKITKQVGMFYDKEIRNIVVEIFAIKYNNEMSEALKEFLVNDANYGIVLTKIARMLSEIEQTGTMISSIYIYTPKGDFHDYNNFKRPEFNFEATGLYKKLEGQEGTGVYWGTAGPDEIFQNKSDVITVATRYKINGYSKDLYVIVNLDVEGMRVYLKSIKINDDNEMLLIDESGRELVGTDSAIAGSFFSDGRAIRQIISPDEENSDYKFNSGDYLITYQPLNVVPWFIVNVQSEAALLESLKSLENFICLVAASGILACLILSVFLTRAIVKPLKMVENTIYRVTEGDFEVQCSYINDNEVGRLGKSFNYMVRQIRELIDKLNLTIRELELEKKKVVEEQELKRTAELKALQAQINPHFLYNTLAAIIWMADSRGAKDICQIASGLGEFYRISLSRGREIIPLKEEIRHVENYLAIQKYRYGDRLQYTFELDDGVMDYAVMKLILQPLVENAIYHGLKQKSGQGEINISAVFVPGGKKLELTVRDNGAGINKTTLELINNKLIKGETAENKGYGIFNINERIKLFYGSQYGLRLESAEAAGTRAVILLPALYAEDMKEGDRRSVQGIGG